MSMLTIWTSNILIIFLVKFLILGGLVYLLVGVKEASDYWRFLWLMMTLYLIIFQAVGTINNRKVAIANPDIEDAPSIEVRASTGISFAFLWAYYPIGFAMLSFWLWNKGWRKNG